MMTSEIFALGTGLCEIMEWQVPYQMIKDELAVEPHKADGKLPDLSDDNPARDIIMWCWTEYALVFESWEEYITFKTVSERLKRHLEEYRVNLASGTNPPQFTYTSVGKLLW